MTDYEKIMKRDKAQEIALIVLHSGESVATTTDVNTASNEALDEWLEAWGYRWDGNNYIKDAK